MSGFSKRSHPDSSQSSSKLQHSFSILSFSLMICAVSHAAQGGLLKVVYIGRGTLPQHGFSRKSDDWMLVSSEASYRTYQLNGFSQVNSPTNPST